LDKYDEQEILDLFNDTSNLAANKQIAQLQIVTNAVKGSNTLTDKVEFWDWMNRNFNGAGGKMFSSNEAMQNYISRGAGKRDWVYKQVQGKGYEWDWMQAQRSNVRNLFKVYEAGDVSNQAAIDVIEHNWLTGHETEYQMKAYISKNNPDLHNTDKSVTVVTNAEKAKVVSDNGYPVQSYKDRNEIIQDIQERMDDIDSGKATPKYSVKNVGGAMFKAGMVGCVMGMGTEVIFSYRQWKEGKITDEEYLIEAVKAGGDSGITAAGTTGIMIPISAAITSAGVTSLLTIPIAFVVSAGVNEIVAPCFGRGKYKKILNNAHYYQSIEKLYYGYMNSIAIASKKYEDFTMQICEQEKKYQSLKVKDKIVTAKLKDLYDSI